MADIILRFLLFLRCQLFAGTGYIVLQVPVNPQVILPLPFLLADMFQLTDPQFYILKHPLQILVAAPIIFQRVDIYILFIKNVLIEKVINVMYWRKSKRQ